MMIQGIPEEFIVDELICGFSKVLVRSGDGYGISLVMTGDTRPVSMVSKTPGMKLRDLACCIKSWNMIEASIGQAAVNAYYNSVSVARKNGIRISESRFTEDRIYDPFISYQNAVRNKKTAVVGHFNYLEKLLQPVCELSVLEQNPQEGDYPYSAAEYILPDCDYVFITCNTFIDKSLPRFLKLAPQAQVIIVGPSTPLAPALEQFGVKDLSGLIIKDGDKARRICSGQDDHRIYSAGQKVSFQFSSACSLARP